MKNSAAFRVLSLIAALVGLNSITLYAAEDPVLSLDSLADHLQTKIPGDCQVKIDSLQKNNLLFTISNPTSSFQVEMFSDPKIYDHINTITGPTWYHFHNYSRVTGNTAVRFRMITTFALRKLVSLTVEQLEYRDNQWISINSMVCKNKPKQ